LEFEFGHVSILYVSRVFDLYAASAQTGALREVFPHVGDLAGGRIQPVTMRTTRHRKTRDATQRQTQRMMRLGQPSSGTRRRQAKQANQRDRRADAQRNKKRC
jgi:hypothetical protein